MSYVKPDAVVATMVEAGVKKARLSIPDLIVRGFLSGALLGFATTLAFTGALWPCVRERSGSESCSRTGCGSTSPT